MTLNVTDMVEDFKSVYTHVWWDTEKYLDLSLKKINKKQKKENQQLFDKYIEKFNTLFNTYQKDENTVLVSQCKQLALEAAIQFTGVDKKFADNFFEKITDITNDFIKEAHDFNENIQMENVMQAMRNVWIMNILQIFLGVQVHYTPSIFAYSMLYPYTDNFMDCKEISSKQKEEAAGRLSLRLKGNEPGECNDYEKQVYKLVEMIENQYPRNHYQPIYESILCIHEAQAKSLLQQKGIKSPYETDLLGISFAKGGSSVIADAYLVRGDITQNEAEFSFIFGAILQLMDDLQDVKEDMENGHMTIFSQTAPHYKLDGITGKLINLTVNILDPDKENSQVKKSAIKLMRDNLLLLLMESVARNKKLFTRKFLKEIQQYCAFSFAYLGNINKKFKSIFESINKKDFKNIQMENRGFATRRL